MRIFFGFGLETADQFAPRKLPEGHKIVQQSEDFEIGQYGVKKHKAQETEQNVLHRQLKTNHDRAMSEIASTMDDVDSIREVSITETVDETGEIIRKQAKSTVTRKIAGVDQREEIIHESSRTEERSTTPVKRPRATARAARDTEDEDYEEISEISEVSERIERRIIRRSRSRQKTTADAACDAAPYSEPKLTRPNKDQRLISVKEEEDLTLEIPYTGAPQPEFTWLKDGKPVVESKQVQTETTQEFARITVREVTKKDSGRYTLIAENFAGIDKIDIGVQVVGKKRNQSINQWNGT